MAGHSKWEIIQQRKRRHEALRGRIAAAAGNAAGQGGGFQYEDARYEGHAPGGVAVIVDCLTDDKARTASAVHDVFTKFGGSVGAEGSVASMFKPVGMLSFAPGADEATLAAIAVAAGADDVVREPDDGVVDVLTSIGAFDAVLAALEQAGHRPDHAEITMRADIDVGVAGDAAKQVVQLIRTLESLDDVQSVYSNAELSPEAYA